MTDLKTLVLLLLTSPHLTPRPAGGRGDVIREQGGKEGGREDGGEEQRDKEKAKHFSSSSTILTTVMKATMSQYLYLTQ